ncbi:uncharacterized protein V1516DRAFT_661538 [Lipomyces oligophaga]|uniref:uncharacterized protein n=1 Tax=Lipomyces oligophaga TaxID=45792 RepID=UPI0034CF534B
MSPTALDKALARPSKFMLLSFTGIVVAACSYMLIFGDDLPKYEMPASKKEEDKKTKQGSITSEESELDVSDLKRCN